MFIVLTSFPLQPNLTALISRFLSHSSACARSKPFRRTTSNLAILYTVKFLNTMLSALKAASFERIKHSLNVPAHKSFHVVLLVL